MSLQPHGPCKICGITGYALSFGGPDICPACDCGIDPKINKLSIELDRLRSVNAKLKDDLVGINLACKRKFEEKDIEELKHALWCIFHKTEQALKEIN